MNDTYYSLMAVEYIIYLHCIGTTLLDDKPYSLSKSVKEIPGADAKKRSKGEQPSPRKHW